MASPTKNIICMKWGTLYGPEYVNKLYAMVRANTNGDIRFVCLTDDTIGIRPEVECLPCPSVNIPHPFCNHGWRKVSLFAESEKLFDFTGNWLFIDLDVIITGTIDDFFTYKPELPFIVMRNWTQMDKKIGNTSVYRFQVGYAPYLLEQLQEGNFLSLRKKYSNSQTFISNEIKTDLHFWPAPWCQLFKVQCIPAWPLRFFKEPTIPKGCRIVAFPGLPNPHEAAKGIWPEKKLYKRIYKFIRPSPWIEDIWDNSERVLISK